MKIAAIDIGSNAVRLQIDKVIQQDGMLSFKKLEFIRYPMQLGRDVFKQGSISDQTKEKFYLLMQSYKNLMDLYEIKAYRGVATSAMREAKNGGELVKSIRKDIGLNIEIISGHEEAKILNKAILPCLPTGVCLHIDVGGGSTELNVFKNRELRASKSFKMGSLRVLGAKEKKETIEELKSWISKGDLLDDKNITSVGTGGNINKLFKIANKPKGAAISLTELRALKAYVNEFSMEERQNVLKLNPDRAEVIVPASSIYISIMNLIKSDHMIVPKVGLKNGLLYELYETVSGESIHDIEFVEE